MPNYEIRICTVSSTVGHIIKLFSAITRNRYWKKSPLNKCTYIPCPRSFSSPSSQFILPLQAQRAAQCHLSHGQGARVGRVPRDNVPPIWSSTGCGCTRIHCVCCSFICSPPVPPIAMFSIQPASYLDSHPVLFLISLGIRGEKINPLYTCRFCRTFISSASSLWCLFLLLHLPPVGTVNTWVWYIFLHWYQTRVWVFFKLSLISSITKHWARKSTRAYPSD